MSGHNTNKATGANRISHAYIAPPEAVDDLAMAALCSSNGNDVPCKSCKNCDKAARGIHPDIITVSKSKDKQEFTVDLVRNIKNSIFIAPNEAPRKVYIIRDADTMNTSAQNAFLQMLEEPPIHAVFILETLNPSALLPTVRSRCVGLRAAAGSPVPDSEASPEIVKLAADFAGALGDNMRLTQLMFELDKLDKTELNDFIALARISLSDKLRDSSKRQRAVIANDLLTDASEMLDFNINTGHISGMLCASLMS